MSKNAKVLDIWDMETNLSQEVTAENQRQIFMSGDKGILLQGTIKNDFATSGSNVSVQVRIKNDSKKRVQGIKIYFVKRLLILIPSNDPFEEESKVKIVDEIVSNQTFKEKDFIYDPNEDRTNSLLISIPVMKD
jgi:hypothetical protein